MGPGHASDDEGCGWKKEKSQGKKRLKDREEDRRLQEEKV